MTKKEMKTLIDISSFISYWILNDPDKPNKFYWILGHIGHDIAGLVSKEKCFVPRSQDYDKMLNKTLSEFKERNF